MKQIIIDAIAYALQNGGATFNSQGLISETKGYMVSIIGMEERFQTIKLDTVLDYVAKNLSILKSTSNLYVGIWNDDSEWCLDVSAHILDKESALRVGIIGEQKAIYDLNTGTDISLTSPQKLEQ